MIVDQANFDNGIHLGTSKMQLHFPPAKLVLDADSRARIHGVLEQWPHDLHGRFVELFVEMSTLASLVRSHNSESALTEDELEAYLAHSAFFFNSFKHR